MNAKEFLDNYSVNDLDVYGIHEEHYKLDHLMEAYAKEYHKEQLKLLNSSTFYCYSEDAKCDRCEKECEICKKSNIKINTL